MEIKITARHALYSTQAPSSIIDTAFGATRFNPNALTSEQIHYFNAVDEELTSEITIRRFQDSDLQ
ncbi:hypothetical protein [Desulfovibrio sp. JC010]|uniref:hypothetical protein n=1 Tax=Desulfovibrio sp. JC010 TaxID=2593641 RepID=UPI0013D5F5A1|nr:hypothetical protein [Desulfovibrio sp. JC010]NDV25516.1 hypothetical protein [Desulfovibrio sp. JC010]